ncbi:UNVERIFIED_ORG: hypothetical protein QOE_0736 [Clostridioides difficile F501]
MYNSNIIGLITHVPTVTVAPTLIRIFFAQCFIQSFISSFTAKRCLPYPRSFFPASVKYNFFEILSNSLTPYSFSISEIAWLTDDWVIYIFLATSLILPHSATLTKISRLRIVILSQP